MTITRIFEKTVSLPGMVWMDLESPQDYECYRKWLTARLREAYPSASVHVTNEGSLKLLKRLTRSLTGGEFQEGIVSDAPTAQEREAEIEEARRVIGQLMVRWLRERPHRLGRAWWRFWGNHP